MSKLSSRAGLIIAHYENVRRVPPNQRQLGEALDGFLSAFVAELGCGEDGIYVRVPKEIPTYGRDLNFYGLVKDGEPVVALMADKDETGNPWTAESIRRATLSGKKGLLKNPDAWSNAFFVGAAKTRLVNVHSDLLWKHCGDEKAGTLRMAWEAITAHGRTWEWEFVLKDADPAYVGGVANLRSALSDVRWDWCKQARERALDLFETVWTPPLDFPLEVLRDSAKGTTPSEAMAYYLMEHPMGPGLRPERAARVTRSGRRELSKARDRYLEKNPSAKRWPKEQAKPWQITEIRPESTMAHH